MDCAFSRLNLKEKASGWGISPAKFPTLPFFLSSISRRQHELGILADEEALTFQDQRVYQEVYPAPGQVRLGLKASLNAFLSTWLTNIGHQDFNLMRADCGRSAQITAEHRFCRSFQESSTHRLPSPTAHFGLTGVPLMDHGRAQTLIMKARITRSLLEGLAPADAGSSYYVMDTEIPGFGVRVFPSGRAVYVVRWKGKPHEVSDTRLMLLEKARTEARRLRLRVEEGETPAVQRLFVEEARRVLAPDTFSAILQAAQSRYIDAGGSLSEANKIVQHTLAELLERMEAEYRSTRTNLPGIRADLSLWRRHTISALGGPGKRLRDITQAEDEPPPERWRKL